MAEFPTRAAFAAAVNNTFRLHVGPERVAEAELVQLTDGPHAPPYSSFSLLFRCPGDVPPVQRIYEMEHQTLGKFEVFLVPVRRDADGLYFEAVFNRLETPSGQEKAGETT